MTDSAFGDRFEWPIHSEFCQLDGFDREGLFLCMVLNALPGIMTRELCWGHGKDEFCLWFRTDSEDRLSLLRGIIDKPDGQCSHWSLTPHNSHSHQKRHLPLEFFLTSNGVVGSQAKEEADYLAREMIEVIYAGDASDGWQRPDKEKWPKKVMWDIWITAMLMRGELLEEGPLAAANCPYCGHRHEFYRDGGTRCGVLGRLKKTQLECKKCKRAMELTTDDNGMYPELLKAKNEKDYE